MHRQNPVDPHETPQHVIEALEAMGVDEAMNAFHSDSLPPAWVPYVREWLKSKKA